MGKKVLEGVRVICFGMGGAAPLATAIIGDFGAEVIKIEPPTGDWSRTTPGLGTREFNRNKKGVALDLKNAEGIGIAKKLIASADVVMESFRPGVMSRLGLGYKDVKKLNPQIIYCSVSAYGQTGPWKDRPGVDGIMQAASGIMSVLGRENEENNTPIKVSFPIVDMTSGLIAAQGILLGLLAKEKHGLGQHIDVSLLESALVIQKSSLTRYLNSGNLPKKTGSSAPYSTPNEAYRTKDGYIMLAAYTPKRWKALCTGILNQPELETDPRFQTRQERQRHQRELKSIIESTLQQRATREWLKMFEEFDLICSPINNYEEVVNLEQIISRNAIEEISFPNNRSMKTIGAVPKLSETPGEIASPYPEKVGQHTKEILKSVGLDEKVIKRLSNEGVISVN